MIYPKIKRFFDFIASCLVLIVLLPLFIPLFILLRFTGEGEVFYSQERIGLSNKPFKILKFATMLKNSPNMGTGDVTVKEDPRVLPHGKFLRKTKINELPQIINVIMGQMSLVGARPLVDISFNQYSTSVKKVIYQTPPGITGLASIVFRDEESIIDSSDMSPRDFYEKYIIPHKGELEKWYQKNASFWTDLKIIFATAWVILRPDSDIVRRWFKGVPERTF